MKYFKFVILYFTFCFIAQAQLTNYEHERLKIPVVVHVLYKDSSQLLSISDIQTQFHYLNLDFNKSNSDTIDIPSKWDSLIGDVKLDFVLSKRDIIGQSSLGIDFIFSGATSFYNHEWAKNASMGGTPPWDSDKYLNVWICDLDSADIGSSANLWDEQSIPGVVINYHYFGKNTNQWNFNEGRTLTYLIAKYLGLESLNEGSFCDGRKDNTCIIQGDLICDTPPHDENLDKCSSDQSNSCLEDNDMDDMFSNFMSNSSDSCRLFFTHDQAERMHHFCKSFLQNMYTNSNALNPIENLNLRLFDIYLDHNPCNDSISVSYLVQNMGTDTVFSYAINNRVGNLQANPVMNTTPMVPFDIDTHRININNLPYGNQIFKASVSIVNNVIDQCPYNDTLYASFYKSKLAFINGLLNIDFDTDTSINKLGYFNPDNDQSWKQSLNLGGKDSLSTKALMLNHYNYPGSGQLDAFLTPSFYLNDVDSPKLFFDIAYAKFSSFNYERFKIYVQYSCGEDSIIFNKAGSSLQSISTSKDYDWYPQPNEWKRWELDMTDFIGDTIAFRFEVENGYGNNFFIDNIKILDTFYVNNILSSEINNIRIYPNPVKDVLFINLEDNIEIIKLELYDMKGCLVISLDSNVKFIDFTSFPTGLYQLNIASKKRHHFKKIVHIK